MSIVNVACLCISLSWSQAGSDRQDRWIVLDGIHRLAKAAALDQRHIAALAVTPGDLAKVAIAEVD